MLISLQYIVMRTCFMLLIIGNYVHTRMLTGSAESNAQTQLHTRLWPSSSNGIMAQNHHSISHLF